MLRFEWDDGKSKANKHKHGISFEEAQSVFFDDKALVFDDPVHTKPENRFLILGRSLLLRVLVVCHCHRDDLSVVRIISARKATPKERRVYTKRGKA